MRLKRSGFSLVLSLTVMAAMVLMVIVLASFLQVESRLAQGNAGYQRAKLNALASARMAVGQLQQLAGPDQRVTMRADMYSNEVTGTPGPASTPTSSHNNPNKPTAVAHQKRYWTGIWATGGVDSSRARDWNVADPHETRLFLGWLTSPTATDATDAELVDKDALNFYMPNRLHFSSTDGKVAGGTSSEGQQLISKLNTSLSLIPFTGGNFVRLVGGSQATAGLPVSGSVQWPATATTALLQEFYGAVDLPTMPLPGPTNASGGSLGSKGRYAYWIGDEGIKAKVNLPDFQATNGSGATMPGLTDWDKGFAGSASQRSAFESVTPSLNPQAAALMPAGFSANFLSLRNLDIGEATKKGSWTLLGLAKARNRNEINLWAGNIGGSAAGDALTSANRLLWHETTPYAYSVLSDTLNGGMKTDLSTAFELPYAVYRGLELYPGQKKSTTKTELYQSLFHAAEGPTDFDFNRPNLLDKIGTPSELIMASPKAPEWAPRHMQSLFLTTFNKIKTQNGGETPDRLGFAYEVPLRSHFFNKTRLDSTLSLKTTSTGYSQRYWALPYSGLDKDHLDNLNSRIIRGPTWDLYRNYYRMYKREIEAAGAASGNALRGQGGPSDANTYIARGVEPLTYATGIRRIPVRRAAPPSTDPAGQPPTGSFPKPDKFFADGSSATDYFARNNLSDGSAGPEFQAEKPALVPFNLSAPWDFSGVFSPTKTYDNTGYAGLAALVGNLNDSSYDTLPAATTNNSISAELPMMRTTRTWPTMPSLRPSILRFSTVYSVVRTGSELGVTIDPIMVIHNPYDVPLEFEGITCESNMMSSPFRFVFQVNTASCNGPNHTFATGGKYRSTEVEYIDKIAGRIDAATGRKTHAEVMAAATSDTTVWKGPSTITIGEAQVGGNENDNRAVSFRIVAGETTSRNIIRLEPGEIKVIATAGTSIGDSSNDKNTFIPGDIGFNISGRAFYKMTPFANVRFRRNNDRIDGNNQRVIWTMDFNEAQAFSAGTDAFGNPVPFDWNDAGKVKTLKDLWANVVSQRAVRDAMPTWDGSAPSLENIVGTGAINVIPRNEGWANYNGYPVGSEGEIWTQPVGPDGYVSSGNPFQTKSPNYVAPRLRSARLGTAGNQNWNFYLINKKSLQGKALHPQRRWFGTPDNSNYYEGSETVNGFNFVDESLLMNFQAMVTGWPMYGNSNSDDAYVTATNQEWTKVPPFNKTPPPPDYAVIGTTNVSNTIPMDPEFNRDNSTEFEGTNGKASMFANNHFHTSGIFPASRNSVPQQILLCDFVRRAADMTGSTANWLPQNRSSPGFNFNLGSLAKSGLDLMQTPDEIKNAPMSPYFMSVRAMQDHLFGYDGKAHTPLGWVGTIRGLTGAPGSGLQFATTSSSDGAFWGKSVTATGNESVILFPIPRRPLLSLAQLGSVAFAQVNTDPDFTVGSSFAHPGIADLTKTTDWPGPKDLTDSEKGLPADDQIIPELGYVAKAMGQRVVRNRSNVRTDHAFAANYALWDSFYFSGLNLNAPSYSFPSDARNWPDGPDLPSDSLVVNAQADSLKGHGVTIPPSLVSSFASIKTALDSGQMPLANKRMTYLPDNKAAATTTFPSASEFPHPAYLARNSLYNGGFNINSTSKAAWKAILNGLKGQSLPNVNGGTSSTASGTALTKFAAAFGTPDTTGNNPWNAYRELSEPEIDALAGKIVEEIRKRGPFMSLSDFVNRRLLNSDLGLKGALQSAIDLSLINNTAITKAGGSFTAPAATTPADPNSAFHNDLSAASSTSPTTWYKDISAYPKFNRNARFPSLRSMSVSPSPLASSPVVSGLGAPGIVTQMDVLNSVGPNLTARSDTFVIRAYGEAHDDAGNVIGKAWVEVVVQRTPEFLNPSTRWADYQEPTRRRLKYRNNSANDAAKKDTWDRSPVLDAFERTPYPTAATTEEKKALNLSRLFGRRFKTTSLRWLNATEI
jgi:hypothetical protein